MADPRFIIDPFSTLSGTSMLVGIGRVRRPRGNALEAELEVLLANRPEGDSPEVRPFDPLTDEHVVWVGCGQIDLLTPGSLWTAGCKEPDARAVSVSALTSLWSEEDLGEGPTTSNGFFPSRRIAGARCFGVGIDEVEAEHGGPTKFVLIPKAEMARALFGVSSRMVLELVDGLRDPTVAPGRGLFNRRLSGLVHRKVIIHAHRRLTKREAVMAGLIIADANVRRSHDAVFQQLSVSRGWQDHEPVFLDLPWPFVGPTRLLFEGRWVKRVDQTNRFVVTRILDIELKLPFDEIELHHPGGIPLPDGRPAPFKVGRLSFGRSDAINFVTGRAPSSRWRSRLLTTRDAPTAIGGEVRMRVVARGGTAPPATSGIGEPHEKQADFSTATPSPSADRRTRPAATGRAGDGTEPPPPLSRADALETTWQAILLAECLGHDDGWEVEALPERVNGRVPDRPYDPVAGILLVEISTDLGPAILVDCGSYGGTRRSLGILVRVDRTQVSSATAARLRTIAARSDGRWRDRQGKVRSIPGYTVVAMNRGPRMWAEPSIYAAAIHLAVTSALTVKASGADH